MELAQAGWRPWQAELLHICERYASTGELKAATTKITCDAHGTRRAGGRRVTRRAAGVQRGRSRGDVKVANTRMRQIYQRAQNTGRR